MAMVVERRWCPRGGKSNLNLVGLSASKKCGGKFYARTDELIDSVVERTVEPYQVERLIIGSLTTSLSR